jgi:hypothetical protein
MKSNMKSYQRRYLYVILLIPMVCMMGFDIGGEYTNNDACGNAELPDADNDVHGFIDMMKAFGHTSKFVWGNGAFWPDDLIDCSVTGGLDCSYGDRVTAIYLHSHGGSTPEAFRITTGTTHKIDNSNTCRSYTFFNNKQWWKLGDRDLRYLFLVSCHSLELSDLAHWDGVARGIHIITGGDGDLYSISSRGSGFALLMNFPFMKQSIKNAWFGVRDDDETVVIMAYGSSQADALNRRDNEQLGWSTAAVSPVTWRAWSWIN